MSVSQPSDKLLEIQQCAHSLLQMQSLTVSGHAFLGKTIHCAIGHTQLS